MKQTKRMLAVVLALVMALSLALPAFAEEEDNPAIPVITMQPRSGEGARVEKGTRLTLTVAANIPNNDPIGFDWYRGDVVIGTDRHLEIAAEESAEYHVVVYNADNPEYCVVSQTVRIEVYERTFLQKVGSVLGSIFIGGPLFVLVWGGFFGTFGLAALIGAPITLASGLFQWIEDLFR